MDDFKSDTFICTVTLYEGDDGTKFKRIISEGWVSSYAYQNRTDHNGFTIFYATCYVYDSDGNVLSIDSNYTPSATERMLILDQAYNSTFNKVQGVSYDSNATGIKVM